MKIVYYWEEYIRQIRKNYKKRKLEERWGDNILVRKRSENPERVSHKIERSMKKRKY